MLLPGESKEPRGSRWGAKLPILNQSEHRDLWGAIGPRPLHHAQGPREQPGQNRRSNPVQLAPKIIYCYFWRNRPQFRATGLKDRPTPSPLMNGNT